MSDHTHILLATLGGQPQVVTFTLDLLLKNYPVEEVIVIHPRPSMEHLQRSLARLRAEFSGDNYRAADRIVRLRSQVLQLDGNPIDDIVDDLHADGTLDTLHHLINDLKRQGYRIHLSVTGGRRLMGLLATSVAALNFDRHDHIWHIYTPAALQERAQNGEIMHAPDSGIKLIKGPFISLGAYIYNQTSTFRTAQEEQRSHMDAQERRNCTSVWDKATPGQRKVLQEFGKGLRPQQVAEQLGVSLSTVHSHKTTLLHLCCNAWNLDPDEHLDYHFLQMRFANYFDHDR